MSPTIPAQTADRHRLSLERVPTRMAKATLMDREIPEQVGAAINHAIAEAGWSIKEAAGHIGREPAQVSRWIAGTEHPQLDTLYAVEALRGPLVTALAELAGYDVTTEIRIRRA